MQDHRTTRNARQELARRLILEYSGAVPAGQVMAAVARTDRLLRPRALTRPQHITACEELVRHRLTERTAQLGRRQVAPAS